MATWQCISGCGACCHLDPSDRPDLADYLTPDELRKYLSMVGSDGWCIHFDTGSRRCRIYASRPDFCRVDQLAELFDVEPAEQSDFAIACCRDQIRVEYGGRSQESKRFERAIRTNH